MRGPRAAREAAIKDKTDIEDSWDGLETPPQGNDARTAAEARPRRPAKGGAVLNKAVLGLGNELARLEREAGAILSLLAQKEYARATLKRHQAELAKIRAKMDAIKKRLLVARRRMIESETGMDELPESELSALNQELQRLEGFSTEWARALGAVELAIDSGGGERKRRMVVREGDRSGAMGYAEGANPTTAIADLAASALSMIEDPQEPVKPDGGGFGRSLDGQLLLEKTIRRGR